MGTATTWAITSKGRNWRVDEYENIAVFDTKYVSILGWRVLTIGFIFFFYNDKKEQLCFLRYFIVKTICTCNNTFYKRVRYCGQNANNISSYTR